MFYVYIYQSNPHNSSTIDIIMVIILKIKKLTKLVRSQAKTFIHTIYPESSPLCPTPNSITQKIIIIRDGDNNESRETILKFLLVRQEMMVAGTRLRADSNHILKV